MLRPLALATLLIAGCARSPSTSVCDIVDSPEKYNGSYITVTGTFEQGHHGALLKDPKCPDAWIAFGSEASPNPSFRDVVWANYLPSGRSITASVEGKLMYFPAPYPGRLLDNYKVTEFHLGAPKSPH
jgi:hypothetical protein